MTSPENLHQEQYAWTNPAVVEALADAIQQAADLNNQAIDAQHPEKSRVCDALVLLYQEHPELYPQGFEPMQVTFEDIIAGVTTPHVIAVRPEKPGFTQEGDIIACCSFAQLRKEGQKDIETDAREKGLGSLIVRKQSIRPDGNLINVALLVGARGQLRSIGLKYHGGYSLKGGVR